MAEALTRTGTSPADPLLAIRSDRALARKAAAGSPAAFAAIFKRHHQALFRYAMSILGDPDDARDVVQETMLKLCRSLPGESRPIELRPWLFRIAHNESISLRRGRAHVPLEEVEEPGREDPDAATRMRAHALIADLGELPERQRSALVMRELNGLSHAEIGTALEIGAGAAKQAVYEARCAMQDREQGRQMSCEEARQAISERDRRRLRGRKVGSHLKGCADCRAFGLAIDRRRTELAAIAPLPAGLAAQVLHSVLGSGGLGGGGGGIFGGIAAALNLAGSGGAAKVAVGAVAATVAAGAISVGAIRSGGDRDPAADTPVQAPAGPDGGEAATSARPTESAGRGSGQSRSAGAAAGGKTGARGKGRGSDQSTSGSPSGAGSQGPGSTGEEQLTGNGNGIGVGNGNGSPGPPPGKGPPASPPGQEVAAGKKPVAAGGSKTLPIPPGLENKPELPKLPPVPGAGTGQGKGKG